MGLTKSQKRKNALIQKEQLQLLKIQKELENVLLKVNDTINVLKVEELQLKSSAVVFDTPTQSNMKQEAEIKSPPLYMGPSVSKQMCAGSNKNIKIPNVNAQEMYLDLNTKHHESEEDDDE